MLVAYPTLFAQTGSPRLMLVTCEDYDLVTGHNASNVVVNLEELAMVTWLVASIRGRVAGDRCGCGGSDVEVPSGPEESGVSTS